MRGKCPYCGRAHAIAMKDNIPIEQLKKRKVKPLRCHLRHVNYIGSFIDKEGKVVDVFDSPVHKEYYVITIGEPDEELKEELEELEEESWEQIYQYEDEEAEEENC